MEIPIEETLKSRLVALHSACQNFLQEESTDGLFERIANLACECTSARYGALGLVNSGGDIIHFTSAGLSEKRLEELLFSASSHPDFSEKILSGQTLRTADLNHGFPLSADRRVNCDKCSFLGVPVFNGQTRYGYFYLLEKLGQAEFSEEDQLVIETLAPYAGMAIANQLARRELTGRAEALEQQAADLTLVQEMAAELVVASEIDPILDYALQKIMETLDFKTGEIFVRPENEKVLRKAMHRGPWERLWTLAQFKIGESPIGQVAESGQPHFLDLSQADDANLNEEMLDNNIHHVVSFPIFCRDCTMTMGVMSFGTGYTRPLNEREIRLITMVCKWVGVAIQNVRLNLKARTKAVVSERERIGMDLHDGIIQSIYAVGLTLDHARLLIGENPQVEERLQHAIDGLNGAIRDIRTYILDLRPRQLNNEDLMHGLQRLVTEFRANTLVQTHLDGPLDGSTARIAPNHTLALFHICQEALANAAKHSRAKKVDVNVWLTTERAILEVRDDGRGFDVENTTSNLGHGLSNIHSRARNVGGDVEISSESGFGTTVLCWVPLKSDE
jgi:two-component system sensor histidine kinase DevS